MLNKYFSSLQSMNSANLREELANGDNNITMSNLPIDVDEDLALDSLDPDLQLELDRLQLEHLKLQQKQLVYRQRMLLKQAERRSFAQTSTSNRSVLPGCKVIVRSGIEANVDPHDGDSSFTAGGGDSLTIPALQRAASRACVACGRAADSFCARCGLTPYCSSACQRRDWADRHKAVCHNLKRVSSPEEVTESGDAESIMTTSAPAPLRRPHSPSSQKDMVQRDSAANKRDTPPSDRGSRESDMGSDRGKNKFMPPGHNVACITNNVGGKFNRSQDRTDAPFGRRPPLRHESNDVDENIKQRGPANRTFNSNRQDNRQNNYRQDNHRQDNHRQDNHRQDNRRQDNQRQDNQRQDNYRQDNRRPPMRQNNEPPRNDENEDWGPKPQKPVVEEKAASTPATPPAPKQVTLQLPAKQNTPDVKTKIPEVKPNSSDVKATDPVKPLVPKNCIMDTLSTGDIMLLAVESVGLEGNNAVCLSMHDSVEEQYAALCGEYGVLCEQDSVQYDVSPGETFSYYSADEEAWYRCRSLGGSRGALLDVGRIITLAATDKCRRLPAQYANVPEFCCVLNAVVKVGESFKCTLLSKNTDGFIVILENAETGTSASEGMVSRWLPTVEYPPPKPAPQAASTALPEVQRPDVKANTKVFLVDVTALDQAYVRPCDGDSVKKFDAVLQDVVLWGRNASPLKEPPSQGQVVIGKFTDDLHYRALVRRTSVKNNKYLLEYIEYGNNHVAKLEDLYPCPDQFSVSSCPPVTSRVTLLADDKRPLSAAALQYLDQLKDSEAELVLTLAGGATTAPSGNAVTLTVVKTNENINKKVDEMCKPEWKKIEDRGGDVVETESIMYHELKYLDLPASGCELEVLDLSQLQTGTVSGCESGLPHAQYVHTLLTQKLADYCNSEIGRAPYLPRAEELCVAQCPPYPQWFRAVLLEQTNGAGGSTAQLLYVDYGNVESVPVSLVRKMLPEFVRDLPAVASSLEIQDFPKDPTQEQLAAAIQHMNVSEEGRGRLRATHCRREDSGMYVIQAPALIAAMKAV